jgi:hypothetical protein
MAKKVQPKAKIDPLLLNAIKERYDHARLNVVVSLVELRNAELEGIDPSATYRGHDLIDRVDRTVGSMLQYIDQNNHTGVMNYVVNTDILGDPIPLVMHYFNQINS